MAAMHGHMAADSCDGEPRGEASLRRALLVPLGCIKAKGGPWMGGIVVLRRTLSAVGVVRAQHRYERALEERWQTWEHVQTAVAVFAFVKSGSSASAVDDWPFATHNKHFQLLACWLKYVG